MNKVILITIALFLGPSPVFAKVDLSALWVKGNNFYQQKQFDSAALCFEQIAADQPQNQELYYNLGNTYYKLNKVGKAVLNYERALRIEPGFNEANENLALAQGRISNRIPQVSDIFFIKWWESITMPQKSAMWSLLAAFSFILIIVIAIIKRFRKTSTSSIPLQLQGVLWFICICFLIPAFWSAKNSESHNKAVVMENDAPFMNVELKGKPLGLIPEGTTVKIIGSKDSWLEVRLPDGRTGWIKQTQVEKI